MSKKTKQGAKATTQKIVNNSSNSGLQKGSASTSHEGSGSKRNKYTGYFWSMSMAPRIDESIHWFQMLPAAFFTACVIMIVRMHSYKRPMSQFYWTNSGNDLVDFFSYYKMVAIVLCGVAALIFLLYRVFTQSMAIKRSPYYIPMIVYCVFVLLSYFTSDYKVFALWGWNDRFEGTMVLLSYMLLLFYIINSVNTEKNVKWIVYPIAATSALLSFLGLSQALNHDFFRTTIGKMLITPSDHWDSLDGLIFTFNKQEIYQTIYNINYVSFYLTLLLPLFGLIFIRSIMKGKDDPIWKKGIWGALFALQLYNLIGSQSSGGFLGMGIVVLLALIVLNKNIIKWWKPVAALLLITVVISGITYERWMPEITGASRSVLGITAESTDAAQSGSTVPGTGDISTTTGEASATDTAAATPKGTIDYMITEGNDVKISYEGNEITFTTYPENPLAVKLTDADGKDIDITEVVASAAFAITDERFNSFVIEPAQDSAGINYLLVTIDGTEWPFAIMQGNDVRFRNSLGNLVSLGKVEAVGWANNQNFGSGRGYIWSRTIPMLKETILLGHGADTYCAYFPHNDYVGKYNADWKLNLVVDKPHNMYFGMIVGTGAISLLALMVLWLTYIVQSIKLYWRRDFDSFTEYTGVGIFLGICGFLVSALVDDSTVSVMPMFYGLLGTGIAINAILKRQSLKG